ncbi:hypothetical protein E2562_020001 [Oryza meyeriana var. granulata]|uniref:Uncharacterized protein n=1 Tax=Oryza meyeriana var. granulata TaxID=110450 RepID=A0A6G1CH58_9ORYZ|nr:hypothetical protein E2562_020001 [Oryza meyeriana var. granulata]
MWRSASSNSSPEGATNVDLNLRAGATLCLQDSYSVRRSMLDSRSRWQAVLPLVRLCSQAAMAAPALNQEVPS